MKKFQLLSFALVAMLAATFTSCVKEETEEPAKERTGIWIGIGKRFLSCEDGGFICIREDNIPGDVLHTLSIGTDEAVSEPVALDNGAVELEMVVDTKRLSPRTNRMLLEQRVMVVDETIVLSETLMRQAYENAGLPYNGQRAEVARGTYDVLLTGNGGVPPSTRITITITIKDGKVTITIRW